MVGKTRGRAQDIGSGKNQSDHGKNKTILKNWKRGGGRWIKGRWGLISSKPVRSRSSGETFSKKKTAFKGEYKKREIPRGTKKNGGSVRVVMDAPAIEKKGKIQRSGRGRAQITTLGNSRAYRKIGEKTGKNLNEEGGLGGGGSKNEGEPEKRKRNGWKGQHQSRRCWIEPLQEKKKGVARLSGGFKRQAEDNRTGRGGSGGKEKRVGGKSCGQRVF